MKILLTDMSGDVFCLNNDEEYIERCGEVFRTNLDSIIIHCTMCEDKFRGFNDFAAHMSKEHVNKFFQPITDYDTNQQIFEENISFLQHDLTDMDLIDMFDLTYLDNILMNNDYEDILNEDTQIDSKTPTVSEPPSKSGILSEYREVRKCNVQTQIEERPHKCRVCGLGFKHKYNMKHHMTRHSLERKHECSECNKKFYTGYELKIHFQVHTGQRPFSCQDCERSFRTKFLLVRHRKRHINQRDFKCAECGKEFFEKGTLQEHELIHNSEKPFACSLCKSVFLHRKSLLRHKRAHAERKTFKCELCDAVFAQDRSLKTHTKKKHKEL